MLSTDQTFPLQDPQILLPDGKINPIEEVNPEIVPPLPDPIIKYLTYDLFPGDADQNIDALMNIHNANKHWSAYWADSNITFSFPDSADDITDTYGDLRFVNGFNAEQVEGARLALGMYENVSGVSFTELEYGSGEGTLRFINGARDDTFGALAFYPHVDEKAGDMYFQFGSYNFPNIGTLKFQTFLHEIGHALGLKHGHETNGPGAMTADKDSHEYSVMTYRSFVGQDLEVQRPFPNEYYSFPQTPMIYDIAAMQRFYGANFDYNDTNTVYSFSMDDAVMRINGKVEKINGIEVEPGANTILRTIWDGGGTDTYDLSTYDTNLRLNLNPGEYSDFDVGGDQQRAKLGIWSNESARGHLFNALQYKNDKRSLIENARGGSGNDIIIGNIADNVLIGSGGHDTLIGGIGNDTLLGGGGIDTVSYSGRSTDFTITENADDTLSVVDGNSGDGLNEGNDTIRGVEYLRFEGDGKTVQLNNLLSAVPRPDGELVVQLTSGQPTSKQAVASQIVRGTDGDDVYRGTDGPDKFMGLAGNDNVFGNDGNDVLRGNDGNDTLRGDGGADMLFGGNHNDVLRGGAQNDVLRGDNGFDRLFGDTGQDVLVGGLGRDILYGGGQGDRFDYDKIGESRGAQRDLIKDFQHLVDDIDLRTIDANTHLGGNQRFKFIGETDFGGQAGELHYREVGAVLRVEGDINGDSHADFAIDVMGTTVLTANDFFL